MAHTGPAGHREHKLADTVSPLAHMPAALQSLLRDLPEIWTHRNEGENTWTAFDVVGHLVYAERADWMPRVRTILEHGESRVFAPFDRLGMQHESKAKTLGLLLDEFSQIREQNLADLAALKLHEGDLAKRGRHPVFGSVTLGQLLATWAAHDLTHLHQLSRLMAHQYREAVGPWSVYLGVMQCDGHSSAS